MSGPETHVLVFQMGTNTYALEASAIEQVLLYSELTTPPNMPHAMGGVLNLYGRLIPVLRLARLFGVGGRDVDLYTPILVIRCADRQIGLIVDTVHNLVPFEGESPTPLTEGVSYNECAIGAVRWKEEWTPVLDAARILTMEEQQRVEDFRRQEERRLLELEEAPA